MIRRTFALTICLMLFAPAVRADDGGWLDWLFRMDPTFVGVATDFHLYCADADGNRVDNCEQFFGLRRLFGDANQRQRVDYEKLRHEINFRIAYYHTVGALYDADPTDSAHAIKAMLFYAYLPDPHFVISIGGGVLPFFGGDTKETRWSGIITPLSIRYFPAPFSSGAAAAAFFVQMESSYITRIPTPDLFEHYPSPPTPAHLGEWNTSIGVGFDFRRRR